MALEFDTLSYALLGSIFSAAALLSLRNARTPDIHPLLLNTQSDVSRVRYPGNSAIYRSRMYPNGSPLLSTLDRSVGTLKDVYLLAFEKFGSLPYVSAVNGNQVSSHTYASIGKKGKALAAGLLHTTGLKPQTGTEASFVGLYAALSPDTTAVTWGCQSSGLVTVPISAQATLSHLSHVLRNTALTVLVVDANLVDRVLSVISDNTTSVKHLVVIGEIPASTQEAANAVGVQVVLLSALEASGNIQSVESITPEPTDIASIYFSNTRNEKADGALGVVLTHKNLVAVCSSYLAIMPPQQRITSKDKLMHNFSIDNVFGYALTLVMTVVGGSVAYGGEVGPGETTLNVTAMLHAAEVAKVTIYASGTSFLNQVKESIEMRYGNSFLFKRGLAAKKAYFEEGRLITDSKYDMLVFRDIKQKTFGSHLRLILIDHDGNAPSLVNFLGAVLGTQVLKSFNCPETTSTATISMFYDYQTEASAVGAPLPCNELKLEDAQDHGMLCSDEPNPRGEIMIRGNNVFSGYWNNPAATAEVLDASGWFATSLLGEILPNGTLKVLGPK